MNNQAQTIVLIRHGFTAENEQGKYISTTDVPLNERGVKQIKKIANAVPEGCFNRLVSSPLLRAVQSAKIFNVATGLEIEVLETLKELDFGVFENFSDSELSSPEHSCFHDYKNWRSSSDSKMPTNAEQYYEVEVRAKEVWDNLKNSGKNTIVLSHGVFLRILVVTQILGLPAEMYRRIKLDNSKKVIVSIEDGISYIQKLNY